MQVFIVEHMEPELWKWCLAEYEHISKIVGKNRIWFTNCADKHLEKLGTVDNKSVTALRLANACLLDPNAEKKLTPIGAKKFDYFIFGGILGNAPAEGRTSVLSAKLSCDKRNLGHKQMSTDTAVLVTKMIIGGKALDDVSFVDEPELATGKNESVILPYRYVKRRGKPVIYSKLLPLLREGF